MLKKLLLWIEGYLFVAVKGYSIERFINLCRAKGIEIWNLGRTDNGYGFYITYKDYKKLRPIARKTQTMPYVKKRIGLPFLVHRYRKRSGFLLGLLVFFVLIYVMSLFIWDISIEGGYKYTKEALLKYVNSIDVYSGMKKKQVDCTEIEEKIRLRYKDISWVSAEVKGTRLIIKITETSMPVPHKVVREPSHMIANKDCIIESIIARNGTPQVKIGDVVKKGSILVSGVVPVKGDFDTIVNMKLVVADADIVCKTYYTYEDELPLNYIKKVYTGNTKKGYELFFLGKKINLYNPRISYDKYDIMTDEWNLKLSWNFYLPFQVKTKTYQEYNSYEQVYTKEEATNIEINRLSNYLSRLEKADVRVLQNDVKIKFKDNVCIASGKIVVEESCWEYKEIEENEWREPETDEHSGDNN